MCVSGVMKLAESRRNKGWAGEANKKGLTPDDASPSSCAYHGPHSMRLSYFIVPPPFRLVDVTREINHMPVSLPDRSGKGMMDAEVVGG